MTFGSRSQNQTVNASLISIYIYWTPNWHRVKEVTGRGGIGFNNAYDDYSR